MMRRSPFYVQLESVDCGLVCLRMIAKYYGWSYSIQYIREHAFIMHEGVSMLGVGDAADRIRLHMMAVKVTLVQLLKEMPLLCVLHFKQDNFVVLYKVGSGKYYIADQVNKKLVYEESKLVRCWCRTFVEGNDTVEPWSDFYDRDGEVVQHVNPNYPSVLYWMSGDFSLTSFKLKKCIMKNTILATCVVILIMVSGCQLSMDKQTILPVLDLGATIGYSVPDTFVWDNVAKRVSYLTISISDDVLLALTSPVYIG